MRKAVGYLEHDELLMLHSYLLESYERPKNYYRFAKDGFKIESCNAWAARELIIYLYKEQYRSSDILDSIERYRRKMKDYACRGKNASNKESKMIFSCAEDVCVYALDFLISLRMWGERI